MCDTFAYGAYGASRHFLLLCVQEAAAELAKYEVLLLLDIKRPVANFGYK